LSKWKNTIVMKDKNHPQNLGQDGHNTPNMELYNAALSAARYEGTLLWQIFSVFLIIHTAIVGFVMQGIDAHMGVCKDFRILIASLAGISLCLLWAATYSRNAAHYRYYLARARENEPPDWHLYGGSGKDFSHGKPIKLGANAAELSRPARWVKSGRMIPPVICVFLSVYIIGLIASSIGCFSSANPPSASSSILQKNSTNNTATNSPP
jgi:hypothetical protein